MHNTVSAKDARELIKTNKRAIVLDVRTRAEYRQAHIEAAVLMPLDRLAAQAAALLPDKDAMILVYCHSGARADAAVSLLVRMGYTDARSFGGIVDWPYETVGGQ